MTKGVIKVNGRYLHRGEKYDHFMENMYDRCLRCGVVGSQWDMNNNSEDDGRMFKK